MEGGREGVGIRLCEGVEEGNGNGHGRIEGKSGEGRVQGRGTGRSMGGRKEDREGNFKGCTLMMTLANMQFTLHKITHNAVLALETLVFEIKK